MAIRLKEEPKDMYENTRVYEHCYFCGKPTKFWHENTNNPCCPVCAKLHMTEELPDFGKRIRANKRKLTKQTTDQDRIS